MQHFYCQSRWFIKLPIGLKGLNIIISKEFQLRNNERNKNEGLDQLYFNTITRNEFLNIYTSFSEHCILPVSLLVSYIVIFLFMILVSDCNKDEREKINSSIGIYSFSRFNCDRLCTLGRRRTWIHPKKPRKIYKKCMKLTSSAKLLSKFDLRKIVNNVIL
jgi:hypothetical protein